MKTESSVVKLPKDLIERLKERRRPHQSIAGAIEELLALNTQGIISLSSETLTRLEDYRTHPRETVDDLIKAVLDELEVNIKHIGVKK